MICLFYSGLKSLIAIATEAGYVLDNATAKFTVFSPNSEIVTDDIQAMSSCTSMSPVSLKEQP